MTARIYLPTKVKYGIDSVKSDPRQHPLIFLEQILGLKPHDAQREVVEAFPHYQTLVLSCGRKWGKSLLGAGLVDYMAITQPRTKTFVVAPSSRQAKIIWSKALEFIETNPKLKKLLKKNPVEFPFPKFELINGSEVHALGTNSDKYIRGEEAHFVVVDEAAFCKDTTISDVIEPMMLVTGGKLLLISTPFGRNLFYQYFKRGQHSGQNKFKSFRFPSWTNPYVDKEYLEQQKKNSSRLKWITEYEADFIENEFAIFRWDDIQSCMENYPYKTKNMDFRYPIPPRLDRQYVSGVDWARVQDFTVASILDVTEEPFTLVNHYRNNRISWAHLKADVRELVTQYTNSVCMDATSLGSSIVEEFDDLDLTALKMGNDMMKYDLVQKLARAIEYKNIAFPELPELIDELKYFEFKITENNRVKTEARTGHDDWVISLALANQIADAPNQVGWFRGVDLGPPQIFDDYDANEEEEDE